VTGGNPAPPPVAEVDGSEVLDLPQSGDIAGSNDVPQSNAGVVPIIDVLDDVIPLTDEADPTLKETNEFEAIDEPICDPDYVDDEDGGDFEELIILDDE
jgi:hypothetical protein